MKQNRMSFLMVGVIFVSLFVFTEGNTKEKTDRWVLYGTLDGNKYYYDKISMRKVITGDINLWVKEKYSKIKIKEIIQQRKEDKLSIDGWEKLDNLSTLYELNCSNYTIRGVQYIYYNAEGDILERNYQTGMISITTIQILPETLDELLLKKVCPK